MAEAWFLAGAGGLAAPPGVRIFQPFGPAEFLAEAEAGFHAADLTQHDLNLLHRLGELLRRLRPQLVHLHGLAPFGVEFLALARRECPQARIVLSLEAGLLDGEGEAVPRFLRAALLRHALRGATILLPGERLRASCIAFGLDPARLLVEPLLPPEATPTDPPPSRRFLVAAAFPGQEDMAALLAAAELLAALPPTEGRRLRIELHGREVESPFAPPSPIAGAHLVLAPSRDPEAVEMAAAAHRRPALRIGTGAALAEALQRLLESPAELAALQAGVVPPPVMDWLGFYRRLPA